MHRSDFSFNGMQRCFDAQMKKVKQGELDRKLLLTELSHDLRTPLANLQGYIEMLSLNSARISEEERARFIQICERNLQKLTGLVEQIFELSYLESGEVVLKKENIMLTELLHDIASKFRVKAQSKGIQISIQMDVVNVFVFSDIDKLERVLTNLIDNAIKYTQSGGEVNLSVLKRSDNIIVEVKDNGVGIKDAQLAQIFTARYQRSSLNSSAQAHQGLGLAISQKLMRLLDSKLEVSSTLGQGTAFRFQLYPLEQS